MDKLGFAIIGVGNIGKLHAQALASIPEARVAVVCDVADRAQAVAETFHTAWSADFNEAVSRPDVDVVCICTPSGAHTEVAEAAATAGKHIVVEKPIEITLERADRIINAARTHGVKLAGIFPMRFKQGPQMAKEALAAGRLGRLVLASAFVNWHRPDAYYAGSWRGTFALDGGGALINQSIHTVDLLQWLAGPVATVAGSTATLAHEIETEDTAAAMLTFTHGGLGVIQGATSCWPGEAARLELHGDKGTIVLEDGCITRWSLCDAAPDEEARILAQQENTGSGSADPMGINAEPHRRQLADMVEAVRENRAPIIDGAEARRALELVLAVYQSARSGQVVTLPLAAA